MAEHELNKIVDDDGEVFNLRDSTKQPVSDRVTSWSSTTSDTKYPSEKLVKTSLDAKSNTDHTHSNLVPEGDNRNVATAPNDYNNKFIFKGIKNKTAIGSPSGNTYSYLFGLRGYDNSTGGKAHELAFNDSGIFTRKGSTTTWDAWEKLATSKDLDAYYRTKDQDISKGVNLVVNGSGTMKSNYNFSTCDYVANTDLPAGVVGCFHKAGLIVFNNEMIAVNTSKTYQLESWYRVKTASTSTVRLSVCCLDIDGNEILANAICYGVGTLTKLTQDLKDGDTVVHLEDLSGARWIATEAYQRGFIFWNYKNSLGYQYPPETYSRNGYGTLYENANVNVSAGTITLNSAWNKGTIPAGTYVSRYGSGSTYYYVATSAASAAQTTWTKLSGVARGFPSPGAAEGGAFRPGTAFIKIGWVNANTSGNEWIEFGGIELREIPETISGVLPIANGGTGKTTAKAAEYNLTTGKSEISDTTSGDDRVVFELASPSESNGVTRGFRKLSTIWTWVKGQISSVLGLSESGYSGNAATATKATQDSDGNAINATYFKSSGNTTLVAGAATKIGTQNGADVKLTLPAHQDISGKMNTSASNATAPSGSGGDGATATLLNNLTDGNSDIVTTDDGDNVLIATTDNGGSVTNKWYKRKLVKLVPWIIKKLGTRLVYDCGAGSTSGDDFDAALAAFNAGQWVIIRKDGIAYYCVGSYSGPGLRFKQIANDASLLKVNTISWTRGSSPSAVTQTEASLSGHTHTRSDITNFAHTHGNIQDSGALQTSDVTIASGDKLVITDSSDSGKVARASASFDGSTTTKALTQKGTFETFMTPSAGNAASGALQNLTAQLSEGTSDFTDNTEIFTSYAGNSGFAESGHVNQPYRRKALSMLNYVRDWFAIDRSPADVGTTHKRISLGYGKYSSSNYVGAMTYLVRLFFNYADDGGLQGKGITVLVTYDFRRSGTQKSECRILSDNGVRDAGYNVVLANYVSGSGDNGKLYICIGLVKNSAPTTLVEFNYSYCKIFKVSTVGDWVQDISSDAVGTYNYLVQATDLVSAAVNADMVDGKHIVIGSWAGASDTIYFG